MIFSRVQFHSSLFVLFILKVPGSFQCARHNNRIYNANYIFLAWYFPQQRMMLPFPGEWLHLPVFSRFLECSRSQRTKPCPMKSQPHFAVSISISLLLLMRVGIFFFFGQDAKIRIKHKCPQDEAHLQVLLARKTHPNSHNKATPGLSYLR